MVARVGDLHGLGSWGLTHCKLVGFYGTVSASTVHVVRATESVHMHSLISLLLNFKLLA